MSQETEVNESMYADNMDEESIGAMFGHGEATEGEAQPEQAEVPQPEEKPEEAPQEKPEPEQKPEPAKEEAAPDDEFVLPLSVGETKLNSDELCNYVELGMQAKQHGEAIQGAFAFQQQFAPVIEALQNNPAQVVEYLQQQGIVQPQAPKPAPTTEDEVISQFKQGLLEDAAKMLLPQLVQQVEEKYKPFVSNMEQFTTQVQYREALSDPMAEQVEAAIYSDIDVAAASGKLSQYDAGYLKAHLKTENPAAYVYAFNMAKKKLGGGKVVQTASAPTDPTKVRRVTRAPKLEAQGSPTADIEAQERRQNVLERALDGDATAIGQMFAQQSNK